MRTVLITGGAGFIGNCLVRRLLAESAMCVINLDKLTYAGSQKSLESVERNPAYQFVLGDVTDAQLLARLFAETQPEAIVHLAAESHVDRSIDDPTAFIRTNVLGTGRLLDAAAKFLRSLAKPQRDAFRLLHVSTDEVFGSLETGGAFSEDSPYRPNSPYAASKAAADHLVRAYGRTYGLPVLQVNCSNNYGPWQYPEKLMPLMILNALEGRPLPVYGDGLQVRDWLFVEDHCRALQRVLYNGRPGECYNIGGDDRLSNLDVVKRICGLVDKLRPDLPHRPCERLITFVADRPAHDRRYVIDSMKLRRELDWRPEVGFTEGLEQTVRWYLDNACWIKSTMAGGYDRQRLGLPLEGAI